ncbi:MAG: carboxypeptidase regulatory-like domain-containing protein, partial [Bacteroidota bacterium]
MKLILTKRFLLMALLVSLCQLTFGQGVTSSSLNGKITDDKGEALIGANILAVHTPTGTSYGNSTNIDGLFRIPNMRVGGPYTITISYTGYQDFVKDNVYLRLGQSFKLDAQLQEGAYLLDDVVVLAVRNDIFDGNRTGAETTVTSEQINTLPTLSRAIGDFARLTPQATVTEGSDGYSISINGMNNRYNAIYVDGAVNNDVFGLAGSGTNGGQTGVSPFSLDAIEEFQISVAPFDVRVGGFAGGAINAITKSGSNNVEGTAYYLFRNQDLVRETLDGATISDFSAKTYGASLGGPIIKDKLFFFVNAEIQRDETPLPFDLNNYEGNANADSLTALNEKLSRFGYDPGTFDDNRQFLDSEKITAKFDYNLSQDHKLSLRYSYVRAQNLEGVQSNDNNIRYLNSSEFFETTTNTVSLELNSIIGATMANNLKIGYTRVRDDRDPFGDPFPYVEIEDGAGSIFFGSERFSTANQLDQDIFTITNNFEIYKGRHNITIGTHNEFYTVYNLFVPFNFGAYTFTSLDDFLNDRNAVDFTRSFSLRDNIVGDGKSVSTKVEGYKQVINGVKFVMG